MEIPSRYSSSRRHKPARKPYNYSHKKARAPGRKCPLHETRTQAFDFTLSLAPSCPFFPSALPPPAPPRPGGDRLLSRINEALISKIPLVECVLCVATEWTDARWLWTCATESRSRAERVRRADAALNALVYPCLYLTRNGRDRSRNRTAGHSTHVTGRHASCIARWTRRTHSHNREREREPRSTPL